MWSTDLESKKYIEIRNVELELNEEDQMVIEYKQ